MGAQARAQAHTVDNPLSTRIASSRLTRPPNSARLLAAMGDSLSMERKGDYIQFAGEDGQMKRVVRDTSDKISVKKIFCKLSDISSVTVKAEKNDVTLTLVNGVEYCLEELDDADAVYEALTSMVSDAGAEPPRKRQKTDG